LCTTPHTRFLIKNDSTFDVSFAGWLSNGEKGSMRRSMLQVEKDMRAQQALKICRLYKFWAIKGMRVQARFL
jgi:hypothetical protein